MITLITILIIIIVILLINLLTKKPYISYEHNVHDIQLKNIPNLPNWLKEYKGMEIKQTKIIKHNRTINHTDYEYEISLYNYDEEDEY